jgi:hypothetical protein
MATSPGLFFWQDKLGRTNPHCVVFNFKITGAKAVSQLPAGLPVLTSFDAIASQAVIDDFLGTTNEFLLAAFDATAMGTDAFACIVNMAGQVDTLYAVEAYFDDGTQVANAIAAAGLTASTLAYEAATGANGNMAVRVVLTGLDAATSGILSIKMYFKSK